MALNPDELMPATPPKGPSGGRVVRLCRDDEEDAMPRGVYDRSRKGEAKPASEAPAQPQKRAYKRKSAAVVPKGATSGEVGTKARFDVSLDLRAGAVTINAANGALTLAPDEVLALLSFFRR